MTPNLLECSVPGCTGQNQGGLLRGQWGFPDPQQIHLPVDKRQRVCSDCASLRANTNLKQMKLRGALTPKPIQEKDKTAPWGIDPSNPKFLWVMDILRNYNLPPHWSRHEDHGGIFYVNKQLTVSRDFPGKPAMQLISQILSRRGRAVSVILDDMSSLHGVLEDEKRLWEGPFTGPNNGRYYYNHKTQEERPDDVHALLDYQQDLVATLVDRFGSLSTCGSGLNQIEAAIHIQRLWRGRQARRVTTRMRKKIDLVPHLNNLFLVQSFDLNKHVVRIQKSFRRWKARRLDLLNQARQLAMDYDRKRHGGVHLLHRHTAAAKIQRQWWSYVRTRRARKLHLWDMGDDVTNQNAPFSPWKSRQQNNSIQNMRQQKMMGAKKIMHVFRSRVRARADGLTMTEEMENQQFKVGTKRRARMLPDDMIAAINTMLAKESFVEEAKTRAAQLWTNIDSHRTDVEDTLRETMVAIKLLSDGTQEAYEDAATLAREKMEATKHSLNVSYVEMRKLPPAFKLKIHAQLDEFWYRIANMKEDLTDAFLRHKEELAKRLIEEERERADLCNITVTPFVTQEPDEVDVDAGVSDEKDCQSESEKSDSLSESPVLTTDQVPPTEEEHQPDEVSVEAEKEAFETFARYSSVLEFEKSVGSRFTSNLPARARRVMPLGEKCSFRLVDGRTVIEERISPKVKSPIRDASRLSPLPIESKLPKRYYDAMGKPMSGRR